MVAWPSCNTVGYINKITQRCARLVLRWVTISKGYTILVCNQPPSSTQPGHVSSNSRGIFHTMQCTSPIYMAWQCELVSA